MWTNPKPFQTALVENHIFGCLRVMRDQLFSKSSILYGYWDHSDTRKRLLNGSSSVDLRAEQCDFTAVFAVESHLLRTCDFAILMHTDMICFLRERQNMIIIIGNREPSYFHNTGRLAGTDIWGQGLRLAVAHIYG